MTFGSRIGVLLLVGMLIVSGAGSVVGYGPHSVNTSETTGDAVDTELSQELPAPQKPQLAELQVSGTEGLRPGVEQTILLEFTATRTLSNVTIDTGDVLGYTVDAEPLRVGVLEAGDTVSYTLQVTPRREVVRNLGVNLRAGTGQRTLTQSFDIELQTGETSSKTVSVSSTEVKRSSAVGGSQTASAPSDPVTNRTNVSASAGDTVTVSGQAAYTYQGNVYGLSDTRIEVYDVENGEKLLATTTSASDGSFSVELDPSNDADGDGVLNATVYVVSENEHVFVEDNNGDFYAFWDTTGPLTGGEDVTLGSDVDSDGEKELVSSGNNAPFQAADWGHEAGVFATENGVDVQQMRVVYPYGEWAYFRYGPSGARITLSDREYYHWDRSTMHHEYGHAVHYTLSGGDLPRGDSYDSCHAILSETDPQFAIVEGFAEYYDAAVSNNPNYGYYGDIESNNWYDFDYDGQCVNGDGDGTYDGLSVEGSVASILWDITDAPSNDDDGLSYDFASVVDTMRSDPASMEAFYRNWNHDNRAALNEVYTTYGIDKSPPTVTPETRSEPYTSSSVSLSGSVTEAETQLESLELQVDGSASSTVASSDGDWSETRTLTDGTHDITLVATDVKGNTERTTYEVRVNSESPTVATADEQVSDFGSPGGNVTVAYEYDVRYPESLQVTVQDGSSVVASTMATDLSGGVTDGSLNVTLPQDIGEGQYNVEMVITDESGRTDSARVTDAVTVDTTEPRVINTILVDDYVNATTPLRLSVSAFDPNSGSSSIDRVKVSPTRSANNSVALDGGDVWNGTVPTPNASGSYTAQITVFDEAGNTNSTIVAYQVDTNAPSIDATAPRYTQETSVNVSGVVSDDRLDLVVAAGSNETVRLLASNETTDTSTTSELPFDRAFTLENGTNGVVVFAVDEAGNRNASVVQIGVDNTEPNGSLVSPGRVGNGSGLPAANSPAPKLMFSVGDNLAGIDEDATAAEVLVDGATVNATADRVNGSVTAAPTGLPDGNHTVTVTLVDRAGNARTVESPFVIDTVRPTIDNVTQSVGPNETVEPNGTVSFTIEATDDRTGVARVFAGRSSLDQAAGNWTGTELAPLTIGEQQIPISVIDAAGNVETVPRPVYVGTRQKANISANGTVTVEPPATVLDRATLRVDQNLTNQPATVTATTGITRANPVDTAVPGERTLFYPQIAFDAASENTTGGSFEVRVPKRGLAANATLGETLDFWVYNESSTEWEELSATVDENATTNELLVYHVETPHYSTFAVSGDVDDTAPSISLDSPSKTNLTTDQLDLEASFTDNESQIDTETVVVRLDGEAQNLSQGSVNASGLELSVPVSEGNHTLEISVSDEYGNERRQTWELNVSEPQSSGGGGGGGGGGGAALTPPAAVYDTTDEGAQAASISVKSALAGRSVRFVVPDVATEDLSVDELGFVLAEDNPQFELGVSVRSERPDAVPALSDAESIGFVRVDPSGISDEQIGQATFRLSVAGSAINDIGGKPEDVTVYRYHDGEWQTLETRYTGASYVVTSSGFSVFAIGLEQPEEPTAETSVAADTETATPTQTSTEISTTDDSTDQTSTEGPGFEIIPALIAVLTLALLLARRQ